MLVLCLHSVASSLWTEPVIVSGRSQRAPPCRAKWSLPATSTVSPAMLRWVTKTLRKQKPFKLNPHSPCFGSNKLRFRALGLLPMAFLKKKILFFFTTAEHFHIQIGTEPASQPLHVDGPVLFQVH